MTAVLTTRDVILERLRKGPALSSELAMLTGSHGEHDDGTFDLGGCECAADRDAVEAAVRRMNERGYVIVNMRSVGGRSVAMYRLIAEPGEVRVCCVGGCDTRLRSGNRTGYCGAHARNAAADSLIDLLIAGLEADLATTAVESLEVAR